MVLTQEYTLPVARGSELHSSFMSLCKRLDLQDGIDMALWFSAQGVKYECSIMYDYLTFNNYDAWVQFRLAWL